LKNKKNKDVMMISMSITRTYKNCPNGCISNADSRLPNMLELWAKPILIPKYFIYLLSI
jgi:hypothetical protein